MFVFLFRLLQSSLVWHDKCVLVYSVHFYEVYIVIKHNRILMRKEISSEFWFNDHFRQYAAYFLLLFKFTIERERKIELLFICIVRPEWCEKWLKTEMKSATKCEIIGWDVLWCGWYDMPYCISSQHSTSFTFYCMNANVCVCLSFWNAQSIKNPIYIQRILYFDVIHFFSSLVLLSSLLLLFSFVCQYLLTGFLRRYFPQVLPFVLFKNFWIFCQRNGFSLNQTIQFIWKSLAKRIYLYDIEIKYTRGELYLNHTILNSRKKMAHEFPIKCQKCFGRNGRATHWSMVEMIQTSMSFEEIIKWEFRKQTKLHNIRTVL